ncbi:hypothetical protein Psyaliredsea_20050 [Psychrobacter alimentarius]
MFQMNLVRTTLQEKSELTIAITIDREFLAKGFLVENIALLEQVFFFRKDA